MDGDVAPSGDLVTPKAYAIYAWRTDPTADSGSEPTEVRADTPEQAGELLARLLRTGHVHFTGNRLTADGLVAYPDSF